MPKIMQQILYLLQVKCIHGAHSHKNNYQMTPCYITVIKEAWIVSHSLCLLKYPTALLDCCNILRIFFLIKSEIFALYFKTHITTYLETMLQKSDSICSLRSHESLFERYGYTVMYLCV